jgi:catechol 2,3-dioxygenase-like lactoylglutathione lyase family enzyme
VRVSVQYPGEAEARQFQFYDDGALFSFAPVEGGHFVTAGGYLFPRLAQGGVRVEELGDVVVGLPSGARVVFSSQTSQLIEHPLQTLANGARIYPQGLFLDLGVREPGPRGNTLPHAGRPEGLALFVDPQGVRCELSNREVFDYSTESPRFKLSDAELKNYLEIRCPGLDRRAL